MARNIELKVRCNAAHVVRIVGIIEHLGAQVVDVRQRDTYLHVRHGRLKLREIASVTGQSAELIGYDRPDLAGSRLSAYTRIPIQLEHATTLREMLVGQLGELVTVTKRRRVAILGRTRVHLDEVDELGCFVELETVLQDEEAASDGEGEHRSVIELLELEDLEAIAGSYSDLMRPAYQDETSHG